MNSHLSEAQHHVDLGETDTYIKCEYCHNSLPSHHADCPQVTKKFQEWKKGLNIGRNGITMPKNLNPTAQVGWHIGNIMLDPKNIARN